MLPVLIGGAVGLFMAAKHEEKKARDQEAFVESAVDALESFQQGNYTETKGMFDDAEDAYTSSSANNADAELPDWLYDLADMEDEDKLPFMFLLNEDEYKPGYYSKNTKGIYTFGEDKKFTPSEKRFIKKSLDYQQYKVEDIGNGRNIRVIFMEGEVSASSDDGTAPSSTAEDCYDRGEAYRMEGQYDAAIRDFSEAIRLDPNYAFAYAGRGDAYRMKDQYDLAIKDLKKAIRLDPNYFFAYGCRGEAYRMKNLCDAAIRDFNEAIRLDPNYDFAYASRGVAYKQMGQKDLAKHDLEKALSINPKNEWAKAQLREIRGW